MPDKVNLTFALGLTPNDIIAYFNSKGYAFSFDWKDVWQDQHSQAFTVAKVMNLDILVDIREMIDKVIKGEITEKEYYQTLEEKLKAKGWWGKEEVINPVTGEKEVVLLGSAWRLKKILDTNLIVSNSAGKYKKQMEEVSFAPWWQYIDMDDPPRVRPLHDKVGDYFEGKVLHYSHPFWSVWYPPNDWGCRCQVINYTQRQVETLKLEIIKELPQWLKDAMPAEGWAYNPGASAWKPDLTKYPGELIKEVGLKL